MHDGVDEVALATLLDLDSTRSTLLSLPPFDRRLRIEAAAIALLISMSTEKPLILVIEDLHWLDKDGLAQIARVCDRVRNERCLVLLSVRDGWEDDSGLLLGQCDYQCHLMPFEPADTAQMLSALVRPGRGTAALSREIVERTRGNPLFVEETLHALHELGALVHEGHIYSLQRPGTELPLAPTVRGLLAARIDRLRDIQKDVLQAVAIIGRSATRELLHSLLDLDAKIVDAAIEQLIAAGLLAYSAPAQPLDQMTLHFRHPLAKEVAYEQTLLRDRVRIHRWMLARLEEEEQIGMRARTDVLAEHALRAEAWDKAAQYLLRAGNQAFWRDAKTEAVRFLLQGLEAVSKSGQGPQSSLLALELRLELRNPLYQLARMDELGAHLAAARPEALALSHPIHTGRYHVYQGHYHWFIGDGKAALREAQAAEALAASSGLDALAVRGRFQKGLVSLSRGEHRDTITIMDDVSAAIMCLKPYDAFGMNRLLLVTSLGYSARAHAELGEIVEARKDSARSLAIARELDNHFAWVFAYIAEGWVNFRADDCERALPFLERAHNICANEEVPLMAPVAASFLSLALLESAKDHASNSPYLRRALTLAERAVAQGAEFQFGTFQPMRLAILSRSLLTLGRAEEALQCAMAALENARMQVEPTSEIEALLAVSEARCSLGLDWRNALQTASSIAEFLHMRPVRIQCQRLELRCKVRPLPDSPPFGNHLSDGKH
jgi:tetratricopeptide (TPR) repeat protein